jgi:RNA polymerase sigma-70 factor (ECF subfamily)
MADSHGVHRAAGSAGATAERVARESYGRLVAILAARTRDIAGAEDALSEAFSTALEHWPRAGVPDNPQAWLVSVARRKVLDAWRHEQVADAATPTLMLLQQDQAWEGEDSAVADERLRLLFVCAHPAIDPAARAPLMLQTVLGLDVARMAGAFLVAPATLGQRLVRAKNRIRLSGVPFEYPQAGDLAARLGDVLDGIYAAFGTGWDEIAGADGSGRSLAAEAIGLGRILCALLPGEPEAEGLLALMLYCHARAAARRDAQGAYVPLDRQDTRRWDAVALAQAEELLQHTASRGRIGPYQLEAAIQSAHTQRRLGSSVPPAAVVALYDALMTLRPSAGAAVSRACAVLAAFDARSALAALDQLDEKDVASYQPYWAARAHVLAACGRIDDALLAYTRAIGLSSEVAVRGHLAQAMKALQP